MRAHTLFVAAVAAGVLAIPVATVQASDQERTRPAATSAEYIVSYAPDSAAAALAAIEQAGGVVTGTVDPLGLARVDTTNASFRTDVRTSQVVTGVARNQSIGSSQPGPPKGYEVERPRLSEPGAPAAPKVELPAAPTVIASDPLAPLQWDMAMIGANARGAWKKATGRAVRVGIIDTGIDASHPDLAGNFNSRLSRNFTIDIPDLDGPCEYAGCVDPANVDDGGHGTHVAGTVAAGLNGLGITGVAPNATLVNVRAGQDSGYFFVFETVAALVYAGDARLNIVNMSFYTDPWLFNCDSADDYVSGSVSPEELADQAMIRQAVLDATAYAAKRDVTLISAAGNDHTDLAAPTRADATSPDYPLGTEHARVVTSDCLSLPSEAPDSIQVASVGPSTTKADYSNYGLGSADIAAPGGWFRDGIGTPTFQTPGNMVLSSYPLHVAIAEGLATPDGQPTDGFSVSDCSVSPCAFYTYLQGTSMASPHTAGVAALIIERHGKRSPNDQVIRLKPKFVKSALLTTARNHACPVGGTEIYTDEGRPPEFNAVCQGTTANNGLYGEGIIDAVKATR